MPAVRREEIALLGAHRDVVDGLDALGLELRGIRGREVEQPLATGARADKAGVELPRDFLPHLVATPADARADARAKEVAAVLLTHEGRRAGSHARRSATPTGVDEPRDALLRVPQD